MSFAFASNLARVGPYHYTVLAKDQSFLGEQSDAFCAWDRKR
jgi:hypothetical protein